MTDNERIARWMGWRQAAPEEAMLGPHGDEQFIDTEGIPRDLDTESLDALRPVETEMEKRGLEHFYVNALRHVMLRERGQVDEFEMVTASPEVRVRAILAMIGEQA